MRRHGVNWYRLEEVSKKEEEKEEEEEREERDGGE